MFIGVFITAFYSFRMFFLVFHGEERMDKHTREHLHETAPVVTVPLILLAIPSAIIGWITVETGTVQRLFRPAPSSFSKQHGAMAALAEAFHGPMNFVIHGFSCPVRPGWRRAV